MWDDFLPLVVEFLKDGPKSRQEVETEVKKRGQVTSYKPIENMLGAFVKSKTH